MTDSTKRDQKGRANDEQVERLARDLAERLRAMPNRQELTDYAVSLLRDSNEEAGQAEQSEQARHVAGRAARGDPFNPIAFSIPLFLIGAVLCATGLLAGIGLGVIAIAVLMAMWGFAASLLSQIIGPGKRRETDGDKT